MSLSSRPEVTDLLHELAAHQPEALTRLLPLVYDELRRLAHAQLRGERSNHTLNTTALVHETYLRLADLQRIAWRDRRHFFVMSARLMRHILIDHARARLRDKRGGGAVPVPLAEAERVACDESEELVALDEALVRLAARNRRQCQVVECRCFAGLTVAETAAALGTSPATVKRDWEFARAWLHRELANPP